MTDLRAVVIGAGGTTHLTPPADQSYVNLTTLCGRDLPFGKWYEVSLTEGFRVLCKRCSDRADAGATTAKVFE